MKTKVNVQKELEKFVKSLGDETVLFAVCRTGRKVNMAISTNGDDVDTHLSALFANLVNTYLSGDPDDGAYRAGKILLDAVAAAAATAEPEEYLKVVKKLLTSSMFRLKKQLDDILDDIEELSDDDDDDDDDDCATCDAVKTCTLPQAIKYRKENHIPKPKKNGKGKK